MNTNIGRYIFRGNPIDHKEKTMRKFDNQPKKREDN